MSYDRQQGIRVAVIGIFINIGLAVLKITAGILGDSFALIADGIESSTDIISSLVVIMGVAVASRPADKDHPYGHGKAESLAGLIVAVALICAAGFIAYQSINNIISGNLSTPHWFSLIALVIVISLKEWLFRLVEKQSEIDGSAALKSDAWHHRADAITSIACFFGILISIIGGPAWASADSWAALIASAIIAVNGYLLIIPALREIMDGAVPEPESEPFQKIAQATEGVIYVEKFFLRKSGINYQADIHAQVDPYLTVLAGHKIAHDMRDALQNHDARLTDIMVHIEPFFPEKLKEKHPEEFAQWAKENQATLLRYIAP